MSEQAALFAPAEIPLWSPDETAPAILPCVRWKYEPHPLEVREQIRAAALSHLRHRTAGEWGFSMHDALQHLDRIAIERGEGMVAEIPAADVEAGDVVLVGSHPFRPFGHDSRWRPEAVRWQHDAVVLTVKGTLLDCRGKSATIVVDRARRL